MVAVDTNIIVRLLTQDDKLQYQQSLEIFQNHDVFIPDTVILETEWVLRFAYKFKTEEICTALRKLFETSKGRSLISPLPSKLIPT
ncbi:PIN domain-containing protein [Pelatocladus sp. BLCC-F211]|uniref:PIN domain-containing protein n=1 Tax=Pelatocladus sp. BLCC-F211 TaxID=3342752 RepID=UPI0035B91246